MMPQSTPRITVPAIKSDRCGRRSPATNRPCTRASSHTGRHLFAWIHLGGKVREVWN